MPRYQRDLVYREIELEGSDVVVRGGHVEEADVTVDRSSYPGPNAARFEYHRAIAAAVAEGFLRTSGEVTQAAVNEELEEQIRADPLDPQPYLVYADWLQTQGDPRGELISIHHAIAEHEAHTDSTDKLFSERRQQLRRAELTLLHQYKEHFYGQRLARLRSVEGQRFYHDLFGLVWYYGFIQGAAMRRSVRRQPNQQEPQWRDLLDCASAKFLRRLEMDWLDAQDLAAGVPSTLHELVFDLGVWWPPEYDQYNDEDYIPYDPEHLDDTIGPAPRILSEIAPILTREVFPSLRILRFRSSLVTDELTQALTGSNVLEGLEVLDLSGGSLTDRGATALINNRAAFRHLKELILRGNRFRADLKPKLASLCKNVRF